MSGRAGSCSKLSGLIAVSINRQTALFDGKGLGLGRLSWSPVTRLALFLSALALNIVVQRYVFNAILLGIGAALLITEQKATKRILTAFIGCLFLSLASFGAAYIASLPRHVLLPPLMRSTTGLVWTLWFSATVPWSRLKPALSRLGVPVSFLDSIDAALFHGQILLAELIRRRDSSILRLGKESLRPSVSAQIIGSGIVSAFHRSLRAEDVKLLRSARKPTADQSLVRDDVPYLRCHQLGVCFENGSWGLKGLNFEVGAAEWLLVAGPSGCGKSTLLRTVAGLTQHVEGELSRFGEPICGDVMKRIDPRQVAMVWQNPDEQFLGSTPIEDLLWGLRNSDLNRDEQTVLAKSTLDDFGILNLAYQPLHLLSFGEKKRVAIAGAMVSAPKLLLCDEPTIGLDPVTSQRLIDVVNKAAARRQIAVIWTSHDLDYLPSKIKRCLLINRGQQVFFGPLDLGLSQEVLKRAGLS